MKKHILDRYSQTDDGKVIIDITAGKIEDLYDDYDKTAPFLKKDLAQGLVDYITDSVREIGKEPFIIRFRLGGSIESGLTERVQKSIYNYFVYLRELEYRELRRMTRTSLILLGVGLSILTLSAWVNQAISEHKSVISGVFAEGLTVAAWVSLWESLATFLINWAPHRRKIKMYERIAESKVLFLKKRKKVEG